MCLKPVIVIVTLAMCVRLSLCSDGPAEEDKAIRNTVVDRVKEMVQSVAGGPEYGGGSSSNAPESVGGQPDATTTPVPQQYGGVSPDAAGCACHDDGGTC